MSSIIKDYYENAGVKPFLIEDKLDKLKKHSDIAAEFEYWIQNKQYRNDVSVEGYTVTDVANMSHYLNGEGAFMFLIELREKPEKAKQKMRNGFKIR